MWVIFRNQGLKRQFSALQSYIRDYQIFLRWRGREDVTGRLVWKQWLGITSQVKKLTQDNEEHNVPL